MKLNFHPSLKSIFLAVSVLALVTMVIASFGCDAKKDAEVRYLIPFRDGDCYKLSKGEIFILVEFGRKDGVDVLVLSPRSARFMPTNERPLKVSNYGHGITIIECPKETIQWPEHPPLVE